MSGMRKDELVVEINHPKNSEVLFRPIGKNLRSRFLTQRGGGRSQAPLNAFTLQAIPGQRIHINFKQRYARITDPLGDPENRTLLETVNKVGSQLSPPRGPFKPGDDEEMKNLIEPQILSWLYYTMLLVEGRRVNLVSPTAEGGMTFDRHPWAEIIQGEFPKEYPTSIALRQSGKILSYNPRPFRGESKYVEKIPEQEMAQLAAVAAEG